MIKLIVISPEQPVENEHAHINAMFEQGLLKLHVRKPLYSHAGMRQYLTAINPAFLSRVVIHSHYSLAHEFGLSGVHYTAEHRESVKPGALYDHKQGWNSKGKTLSTSFHSSDIFSSSSLFDYVFYSPVANSISKKEKQAVDPVQMIIDLSFIKSDVIALGGISPETLKNIDLNWFQGVAALGWIWHEGNDPVKQFNLLKETCHATALM